MGLDRPGPAPFMGRSSLAGALMPRRTPRPIRPDSRFSPRPKDVGNGVPPVLGEACSAKPSRLAFPKVGGLGGLPVSSCLFTPLCTNAAAGDLCPAADRRRLAACVRSAIAAYLCGAGCGRRRRKRDHPRARLHARRLCGADPLGRRLDRDVDHSRRRRFQRPVSHPADRQRRQT